jgi:DNA-binding CsgD family transcriptional regulator
MSEEPTVLVVEPEEARRHMLEEALGPAGEVVEAFVDARRALEERPPRKRVVVMLPQPARRDTSERQEALRRRALELFARAQQLEIPECALDGRGCDLELYTALRSIGAVIWPESTVEEAVVWCQEGLTLTLEIKDRIAQDLARAHIWRELALTPAELTLLFRDLLDGGSYEALGGALDISAHTVKAHFRNMRQSTGLSREELRSRALRALVFARGFVERE